MDAITKANVDRAVQALKDAAPGFTPEVALILGSGSGELAAAIENAVTIPYKDVPGMPVSTVSEHAGNFVLGTLAGRPIACMQGRVHAYEGYTAQQIAFPVHVMNAMGAKSLFVTNAAGGIRTDFGVGDLMLITDHINFLGCNPVIGPVDEEIGPRFFDMTQAYSPRLQQLARTCAKDLGIDLQEGVYVATTGPSFETPAEIRAFRAWGADAVGMSTVLEVIAANRLGMEVLGVSLISNPAAGISDEPLLMDDVIKAAGIAAQRMEELAKAAVAKM